MLKGTPSAMTFAGQNAVVDSARVAANMDAMAMALANARRRTRRGKNLPLEQAVGLDPGGHQDQYHRVPKTWPV